MLTRNTSFLVDNDTSCDEQKIGTILVYGEVTKLML